MKPELLVSAVGCTPQLANLYAPHLAETCALFDITGPVRLAAFLPQIGHESGSFRHAREIWGPTDVQRRYEGRADLGNTQPGDGSRYRGRGLIQTTGRDNYRRVRDRLRQRLGDAVPDFEAEPEALEQPRWAALSAGDYWDMRGLNALADAGKSIQIGRAINRGNPNSTKPANGEADRLARHKRALAVLMPQTPAETAIEHPSPVTAPPAPPPKDTTMPIPAIIATLGGALINAFTPLAAEKLQREIARHTDRPEVAEQITAAAVEAAKAVIGTDDPIEAVAKARTDPDVMAAVESSTLDRFAQMAPMLQQLDAMDRQAFADTEDSRNAAAARAQTDSMKDDMGRALAYGGLAVVLLLILFVGAVVSIQIYKSPTNDASTASWAALTALIGWATAKVGSIYDYRFGSSRGSATKDAVIAEVTRSRG